MGNELDHLLILKSLQEIPFSVGKKLLCAFLQGDGLNESVRRNRLDKLEHFGSLAYTDGELGALIDNLVANGLVQSRSIDGNSYAKVFEITAKGIQEIKEPSLHKRKLSANVAPHTTIITDQDKALFAAFGPFLQRFDDAQKKAIISNTAHILCIAGAGSGKTTVLTTRIEFLVKYRSVDPSKILAITFTRKARQEMIKRLATKSGLDAVNIETFNSFCEGILRQHAGLIYGRPVRVLSYRDKMALVGRALGRLNMDISRAVDIYFTQAQKRDRTPEQLASTFMNDCFFVRDHFKSKNLPIERSSFDIDEEHLTSLDLVIDVCKHIEQAMDQEGLRDFTDQLLDTLALFKAHKDTIPSFDHILVDEYQDVNKSQIELIDMLGSSNIFAVGDPRQSIFGWRGSDISHILRFQEKYPACETISLTKNYRSTTHIVELINRSIASMNLADLEAASMGEKNTRLFNFDSEDEEFSYVLQSIKESGLPRNEIFVLARTNKQLSELSQRMHAQGIKHIVRSDEMRSLAHTLPALDEVTLATIHAIKGLEAHQVFVVGCTYANFPCKGSEHPVIEMVKTDSYDKEEEERRLFYVAMSRARHSLHLTYSGKRPTPFITDSMMNLLEKKNALLKGSGQSPGGSFGSGSLIDRLRAWRSETAAAADVPPFMILHDKAVIDIATKMPSNRRELQEVYGLGPTKIMKYGEELLKIVQGG